MTLEEKTVSDKEETFELTETERAKIVRFGFDKPESADNAE